MSCFEGPYNVPVSGLVLHLDAGNKKSYPGSGLNWYDLSGRGGYAVCNTTPVFVNGAFNCESSAGPYFTMSRSDLNAGSWAYPTITAEMWIKPGTGATSDPTVNNLLTVESAWEISIGNKGNGWSDVAYASTPWAWAYNGTDKLNNSTWNHLVFTHSVSARRFLVNGVLKYNNTGDTGNIGVGLGTYPYLSIMSRGAIATSHGEGTIAIVKIYNRVLSDSEIMDNFLAHRARFGL